MKYLKDYRLFENNEFPIDPEEIRSICEKYEIKNYTINPDGSVDVDGEVKLTRKLNYSTKLPLKFGKVSGNFRISHNNLISLVGSPKEVGGYFSCYDNQLYMVLVSFW